MDYPSESASVNSSAEAEDHDDANVDADSNCSSYEETAAKIEMALRRGLKLDLVDARDEDAQPVELVVDVKSLPGYQDIPPNCPSWKRTLIEKKNKQLEEEAMQELLARKHEEDRWKNVPGWKKNLILEKERKKQQEMAESRRLHQVETERLNSLPEWKRHLVIKKRENEAA